MEYSKLTSLGQLLHANYLLQHNSSTWQEHEWHSSLRFIIEECHEIQKKHKEYTNLFYRHQLRSPPQERPSWDRGSRLPKDTGSARVLLEHIEHPVS